ncbi:MAG TPA: flagellar basal body P-ring protein FlgI [Bryobacteraceae bacterium]|nr:flagellar basal body P-ring protein FlgI [Bryobacteraceae bacterium]
MRLTLLIQTLLAVSMMVRNTSGAARVKELASIEGVRDNQLIGYGLVVGLAGTGDKRQTLFAAQSLTNLLERMGVAVSPGAIQVSNTAAVIVTATLPPFGQPGTRVDVTAAAIGDAKNLQGGLLLLTPLKGADGNVYAAAQGAVVTGGFIAGGGGNTQTLNHPTTGRVPAGGIVERAAPSVPPSSKVHLQLRQADFTTAARIASAINKQFGGAGVAHAENAALVTVETPSGYAGRPVEFISEMESLLVEADRAAKIIINERTGTITMGKDVKIAPVSILQGGLTVQIETTLDVSQPNALAAGSTKVVPTVGVTVKEEKARNVSLKPGATVEDLVRALMAIGSTPRDVIAILQNLRAAGALDAEIEVL